MRRLLPAFLALWLLVLTACGPATSAPAVSEGPETPSETETPETPETPEAPAEPLAPEPAPAPEPTAEELAAREIEDLLASMTPEEKVGQLFFVRCPASHAAEDAAAYHLGGYLLFGRDFQDASGSWLTEEAFTETLRSYQDAAAIPLLIGVDEEGGTVARASRNPNLFPQKARSPQALAAAGQEDSNIFAEDAWEKSQRLRALGINVNLAPVADVSTDPGDFIYSRALGRDAVATAEYVRAVVGAMKDAGIGSVLKHFPGYGSNADTHTGVAVDTRPWETFTDSDLVPFAAGMAAGGAATAVLVSHNLVTCMDGALPASLSPAVHEVLREELGFSGVVMTDDLAMDAVAAYAREGSAAVLAIAAGNDLVVTSDYRAQIPQVLAALADGTLDPSAIDTACRRVLTWKQALGLLDGGA